MSPNPYEIDREEREYGPEWWALGGEQCACRHRADEHSEVIIGEQVTFPCIVLRCTCQQFTEPS